MPILKTDPRSLLHSHGVYCSVHEILHNHRMHPALACQVILHMLMQQVFHTYVYAPEDDTVGSKHVEQILK
jgi:hypothetical protein